MILFVFPSAFAGDDALKHVFPSKQKAVFELREIEQFSNEEVAHILGLSADQAKSNYHHARKAVAKYLSRYGIQ